MYDLWLFKSFFFTPQAGTQAFGFATTTGELCNAIIMFCSPWIINRIGAKNALLIAGAIMTTRIIGSAFASPVYEVVALKMLHALEVPFLLVGAFKYITGVLIPTCRRRSTWWASTLPDSWRSFSSPPLPGICMTGLASRNTYLILGSIVLTVTIISAFTLSKRPVLPGVGDAETVKAS